MRSLTWFGRRHVVGCVSLLALAGVCAATPASAADLYTEPSPGPYTNQGYPPPPAYGPPPYVQQRYVPAPAPYYGYRPYPAYRPYGWADPGYGYPRGYVEVAPRPPAPIARPWGAYPQGYDAEVAEAAPPAYGYPAPPPRW